MVVLAWDGYIGLERVVLCRRGEDGWVGLRWVVG